jgi:hypothetical protein
VPYLARDRTAQLALKSANFFKNACILTRIWNLDLHVWRGRLKSNAVKDSVEDRVKLNKRGLWTYKIH